eukprot:TRINITY_DN5894_c0_g1_i3.p1 TRINITY_DN5894_c0_g1~~TRINITY_DN5894_c0_g1_i3.p1  ORF type:complete len:671 (+),score=276.46 TRINITY_DN5894_c0_g1_i3:66-2078(+)
MCIRDRRRVHGKEQTNSRNIQIRQHAMTDVVVNHAVPTSPAELLEALLNRTIVARLDKVEQRHQSHQDAIKNYTESLQRLEGIGRTLEEAHNKKIAEAHAAAAAAPHETPRKKPTKDEKDPKEGRTPKHASDDKEHKDKKDTPKVPGKKPGVSKEDGEAAPERPKTGGGLSRVRSEATFGSGRQTHGPAKKPADNLSTIDEGKDPLNKTTIVEKAPKAGGKGTKKALEEGDKPMDPKSPKANLKTPLPKVPTKKPADENGKEKKEGEGAGTKKVKKTDEEHGDKEKTDKPVKTPGGKTNGGKAAGDKDKEHKTDAKEKGEKEKETKPKTPARPTTGKAADAKDNALKDKKDDKKDKKDDKKAGKKDEKKGDKKGGKKEKEEEKPAEEPKPTEEAKVEEIIINRVFGGLDVLKAVPTIAEYLGDEYDNLMLTCRPYFNSLFTQKSIQFEKIIGNLSVSNEDIKQRLGFEPKELGELTFNETVKGTLELLDASMVKELYDNPNPHIRILRLLEVLFLMLGETGNFDTPQGVWEHAKTFLKNNENELANMISGLEKKTKLPVKAKMRIERILNQDPDILKANTYMNPESTDSLCQALSFVVKDFCEFLGIAIVVGPNGFASNADKVYLYNQDKVQYYNDRQNVLFAAKGKFTSTGMMRSRSSLFNEQFAEGTA